MLKEKFKTYQTFQIKPSDIKNALRKSKGDETQPQKIKLTIGTEDIDLNLFENDILSDDFVYLENGKVKEKKQKEVITYAGYIGDNPKNFLRFLISDNRLSGIFKTEKGIFSISHLSDNGIKESNSVAFSKRLVLSNADDEISSLDNSFCGNQKTSIVKSNQKNSSSRTAVFSSNCKYIKLAIATDYEYFQYENTMNADAGISGLRDKIYDMVNKMEFVLFNNNQTTYLVPAIGLRLQLSALTTYTTSTDPFNYEGSFTTFKNSSGIVIKTTATIDGNEVLAEFVNKVNQGVIFPPNVIINQSHFLTGKAMGASDGTGSIQGTFTQYGQANTSKLCKEPNNAASVNSIKKLVPYTTATYSNVANPSVTYADVWTTMLHEMGHVMGGNELECTSNPTIMCPKIGKQSYFNQQSVTEINAHLNSYCSCQSTVTSPSPSCLDKNIGAPTYSNNFALKLNGNDILSTPVFVNSLTKTVDIPISSTLPVTSSTFSSSNNLVTVTKINNNKATFKINSAPSFTFNVYAQNSCSFTQWGVPFVYSPSGARIAYETYPNPADDIINLQPENNINLEELEELADLDKIQLFSEKGIFIKEISDLGSKKINTQDLKNGLYYLHLIDKDGNVEKKRIIINHQ